jgi:hypothetical protein
MPSITKSNIRSEIAKAFYTGLQSKTTQLYYLLGKIDNWSNELVPPVPQSSGLYEFELRKDSVRFQQVSLGNVSLGAKRNNWRVDVVYDMYDTRSTEVELANANMFVLTEDFNIYKCIFNNYGEPSTVKPTGTSTEYVEVADGYVWKFMKSLSTVERTRYLTPVYMPVSDVVSGGFFNGGITNYQINNGGTGYDPSNTVINITNADGLGATFDPIISGGVITGLVVESVGSGYTQAEFVVVCPDAGGIVGTGADVSPIIGGINLDTSQADVTLAAVDGELSAVYILSGGLGYASGTTTVTIEGDGTEANLNAIIDPITGTITGFSFIDRGKDYTNADIIVTGEGTGFSAEVILAPEGGHGFSLVNETYADALVVFLSDIDSDILTMSTPDLSYRQVALMVNPFGYGDAANSQFRGDTGTACWRIDDASLIASSFNAGDLLKVQGSTNDLMIVAAIETGKMLLQISDEYIPTEGDILDLVDAEGQPINTSIFTIPAAITEPTVDRFSGQLLFIDNRAPFKTDLNQIANIRTLIKF